jgi:hypothetical protein
MRASRKVAKSEFVSLEGIIGFETPVLADKVVLVIVELVILLLLLFDVFKLDASLDGARLP